VAYEATPRNAERHHARVAEQDVEGEGEQAEDQDLGEQAEVEGRVVGVERRRRQDQGRRQEASHSSDMPS
jgi:hypothetical protein